MDNAQVKAMLTAMGALAEVAGLFYRESIKNGFTDWQAFELTKVMIANIMTTGKKED